MIIDFHTHIFPDSICRTRDKYFPAEPEFKLLYDSPKSKIINADHLLESMDNQHIDKSVVFGFPWRDPDLIKKQNEYIGESIIRHSDRLIGFCCLNPEDKSAESEAKNCLGSGFAGVGELAFYNSGIDKKKLNILEPIMNICRAKNVPVLLHTNEPVGHYYPGKSHITLNEIYMLIRRFQNNKIVLAHWGGGLLFFQLLKKDVKQTLRNVYFDTAASPFLYDNEIYKIAINIIGKEKIIFGSDYPLIKPDRYFNEFKKAGLTEKEKQIICGKNAAGLLNMPFE